MSIADRIETALLGPSPLALHILLGLVIFIETGVLFAFFIPGDSILFGAGLVVASRGDINIATLVCVIFLSAFLGDQMGYYLGRKYGRGYLMNRDSQRLQTMVKRADQFYEKYGLSAVILARFYPWIRTIIPPLAGIGKMSYRRFVFANLTGAFIWGVGITLLGYFAASNPHLKDSSRMIAAFFVLLTLAISLKNLLKLRQNN